MSVMALAIGGCVCTRRLAAITHRAGIGKSLRNQRLLTSPRSNHCTKTRTEAGAYNRTIRRFWAAYERDLAMPLIRNLAMEFPDQLIAQYWLDRARSAEPELTDQYLGQDFLIRYFKPKLAAQCGGGG